MDSLQRWFAEKWESEGATEKLYLKRDLIGPDSVVFDIGGYKGEWAEAMVRQYDPHIYIFEPVVGWVQDLARKFNNNPKVRIYPYGLASESGFHNLYLQGSGSSLYRPAGVSEACEFRDIPTAVCDVLGVESVGHARIDLMAVNIEGGEYDLFKAIFKSGLAWRVRDFLIQFHAFWPASYDDRQHVRQQLAQTHECLWEYPFVWEMWRLR